MARPGAVWDFVDFLLHVLEFTAVGGGEVGDSGTESIGDVEWCAEDSAGVNHYLASACDDGVRMKRAVVGAEVDVWLDLFGPAAWCEIA